MYRVYNHNETLLGEFPTRKTAQAEVREYRKQTGNEAYVEEVQAWSKARILASEAKGRWPLPEAP